MCTYSQMIRSSSFQEGEAIGEKRGEIRGEKRGEVRGVRKSFIELYLDGDYPLEKAAAKCSLSIPEFLILVDKYKNGQF